MSFSTNIKLPAWLLFIQGVELTLLFIFMFFAGVAAITITQNKLFHSNLRLLTNIMGLSWFLLTASRILSILSQFLFPEAAGDYILLLEMPHLVFEACRTFSVALGLSGAIMMILERITASLMLDTYERRKHSCLVLLGVFLTMPFTSSMAYFTLTVEFGYVVATIGGCIGVVVFSAFMLLDRWNRHRLDLAKHGFNYTLTQRFQLSENIRAAEIIYKTVMCCSAGSIIVVCLFVCYRFAKTPEEENISVAGSFQHVCLMFYLFNGDFDGNEDSRMASIFSSEVA